MSSEDADVRFEQYLLAHGYVTEEELARADQSLAGRTDLVPIKSLAQALVGQTAVTPNQVRRVLAALKQETSTERPATMRSIDTCLAGGRRRWFSGPNRCRWIASWP